MSDKTVQPNKTAQPEVKKPDGLTAEQQQSKAKGEAAGKTTTEASKNAGTSVATGINSLIDGGKELVDNVTSDKKETTPAEEKTKQEPEKKAVASDNEADEKDKKSKKGFFDGLDIGNMLGGVGGALGGWFLGNIFGGGMIGKVVGGLLALGGFFMGKKAFGNKINGLLGRPSDPGNPGASASNSPEKQHSVATAEQPGKASATQSPAQSTEMDPELAAKLLESYNQARGVTAANYSGNGADNAVYIGAPIASQGKSANYR